MQISNPAFDEIHEVIRDFYSIATRDILIGYHFRHIDHLDEHIERISHFWYLQLYGEILKKEELPFHLLRVHLPLGIKRGEIGRWLVLFKESLERTNLSETSKDQFLEKVNYFKEILESKLHHHR